MNHAGDAPMESAQAGPPALRAVALFEAAKGVLAGVAAASLLTVGPDGLRHAIKFVLHAFWLDQMLGHPSPLLVEITDDRVHVALLVLALYACMRFIEAWGLWRHHAWASWLGVIGAAVYLPFELDALIRHPHALTMGLLAINLLIVAVLARDLARRRSSA